MTILTYGIETWENIRSVQVSQIEKIQGYALKRIFQLPVSTAYNGTIMETRIWKQSKKFNMLH